MNEQLQGTTEQLTTEPLTDAQLEQLLAQLHGGDGEALAYVTKDAADEAEEDKVLH